jgi:hypothetical protein
MKILISRISLLSLDWSCLGWGSGGLCWLLSGGFLNWGSSLGWGCLCLWGSSLWGSNCLSWDSGGFSGFGLISLVVSSFSFLDVLGQNLIVFHSEFFAGFELVKSVSGFELLSSESLVGDESLDSW